MDGIHWLHANTLAAALNQTQEAFVFSGYIAAAVGTAPCCTAATPTDPTSTTITTHTAIPEPRT